MILSNHAWLFMLGEHSHWGGSFRIFGWSIYVWPPRIFTKISMSYIATITIFPRAKLWSILYIFLLKHSHSAEFNEVPLKSRRITGCLNFIPKFVQWNWGLNKGISSLTVPTLFNPCKNSHVRHYKSKNWWGSDYCTVTNSPKRLCQLLPNNIL